MEPLLTPREIAELLQISYETALAFIKYSGIDYIKIHRQYRVEKTKLMAFITAPGKQIVKLDDKSIYDKCSPQKKITLRRHK